MGGCEMDKIFRMLSTLTILLLMLGHHIGFLSAEPPATLLASEVSYSPERPPRFEDFPAAAKFTGQPAPVNIGSHKEARMFRTRLREGTAKGPSFAGRYTVVMWGCGAACQMVAVVDAGDGHVSFAPFTTTEGASYRLDSRLFIANPPEKLKLIPKKYLLGQDISIEYYVWENKKFRLICKFPISELEKISEF
jgi:hypothetical protein